ncbi:MAG TPA: phospholipase D-like domain-containing protein [Candidatus Nanoarchaeia archaeon]|nr:phospholipase D-like domain-containing protein [Candidatus Nanoarchaeia archaeon]
MTTILISCSSNNSAKLHNIPNETAESLEIYFCPKDDCSAVLADKINSANNSVYCAFYDLDLKNVVEALETKKGSADVRLVIDSSTYKNELKKNRPVLDDNNQLMHDKFCVIDNYITLTGSFNPTFNDNNKNNNNLEVIYSKTLAKNYNDEFSELFRRSFGKGALVESPVLIINGIQIENYFCPEDKCEDRVANLIKNSNQSVYFMTFSFTSEEIADALLRNKNIKIKGIFDRLQSSSKYSQYKRLKEFGLNVSISNGKGKLHHKVFIIDNQTVITGSFNPTSAGDGKNDENIIIIHNSKTAKKFLEEFENIS